MNASCRGACGRTRWRWRWRPTLSNLVQPCPTLAVAMPRTYPQGAMLAGVDKLDFFPACYWLPRGHARGRDETMFTLSTLFFVPATRARAGSRCGCSHVGNEVPATRQRAICQSARFLPAGRRLPLAKKRQWQKAGVVGNCNLAAELQWRAGLQAAIPILSANSNQSCNSKLEKFTSFGNTRSFGKFPIRAAFLTDSVFLNENSSGRENCQTA